MASDSYQPSPQDQKDAHVFYDRMTKMAELKDKKFPHYSGQYGQRSFNEYIDDGERILNGYTLSREAQDKEDWQSNMMDNTARAKLRGIVSGVGLKVPPMTFTAVNKNGVRSVVRAEVFGNITKQSFLNGNPTLDNFLEVWQMLGHGIIFKYEGYKTGGAKVRRVKSFDSRTGEVETEEVYIEGKGKPFSATLNPQEFFWWDMFKRDIQTQERIAWEQVLSKKEVETEFSKFKNYKYLKDRSQVSESNVRETLYFTKWSSRIDDKNGYLVSRMYDKEEDAYRVYINGVKMIDAPLLWGDSEKYYPFASEIAEPFANPNFITGMHLGGILEAWQDQKNTTINTIFDKLYRSMEVPMLIGLENKDLFDFESSYVQQDNKYYVPNVEAVKPMKIDGVNQGELAMLQVIERGIEQSSIDRSQQGLETMGDKTAREAIIEDERARELKGMLYMFLENLWLQKYRLRNKTILMHDLKDRAVQKAMKDHIITVQDYSFGNGERGVLDIHIAKNTAELLPVAEIDARELAMAQQGIAYKLISITSDYMDDWEMDYQIVPLSFHNQDRLRTEQELDSEVTWVTTFYPEFFVANKDKYLSEKLALRGKHPDEFNAPAQPPAMPAAGGGGPTPTALPEAQPAEGASILGL